MSTGAKVSVPAASRLLLVDGHSYAYRAFFAIRKLSSPAGTATNAIYGFIRMLGKTIAAVSPTHLLVVWDGGLAEERRVLLPEYKAQREEMPADMEPQLDQIVKYLEASGITSWVKDGVEADDCIAAVTEKAVAVGAEVVIATSDKDFMQLVSPQVRLLGPGSDAEAMIGAEQVRSKTGVNSTQIVDWLSMVGDSVDNIPGVQGIGPKTAAVLLEQHGTIDEMYLRLPQVTPARLRNALESSEAIVRRNQRLVRLNSAVPCELSLDELKTRHGDTGKLRELFSEWGFRTLLRELEEQRGGFGELFEQNKEGHGG